MDPGEVTLQGTMCKRRDRLELVAGQSDQGDSSVFAGLFQSPSYLSR